ncbi:hypothetical protein SELMODRAFT_404935 [Selaginella moellendorffii]|uniref:Uncharacterized protein n=1 Tax=Selaginella moellendorffii TaxID=88036 RepID=D8QXU9_SELML|nr:hypothetical protein SELMODRAFT_404935 [Selaginella moellendorffii]
MDVALAKDKILAAILRQFATFTRMEGMLVGDRVTVKVRIPKEVHIPFEIELKPGKGQGPRRIRVMLLPNPSICIICRRTGHIGKHCLARGASMGGMQETGEDRQKTNSGSEGKKRGARGEREIIEKAASSGESKKPRTKGQKEEGQGEQSTAAKPEKGQSGASRGKEWRLIGRLFEGQAMGEAKGLDTDVEIVQDKGELPPHGTNPPKFLGEWIDNRIGYAPPVILILPGQDIGRTLEDILAYNFNWNPQRFSIREDNFVEEAPNSFRLSSMDLVYKFTKGKYFWNPVVSCSGGTLIVVKGPWESLVEDHAILVPEELDKDGGEMRNKRTSRERAMWAQLVLALGLEDTYNIPGFVQHQPRFTWQEHQQWGIQQRLDRFYVSPELGGNSGKLDIATGYRDFSDHNLVSLTLPILKRWGTRRPAPVSWKNFEDRKLNDYIKEKWNQQEGGDLHEFTTKIANEIRKKTQNKQRKVYTKVQAIRRNIEAIKRFIRLDPLDTSLRTQLARTKAQLFTLEAEKNGGIYKVGTPQVAY